MWEICLFIIDLQHIFIKNFSVFKTKNIERQKWHYFTFFFQISSLSASWKTARLSYLLLNSVCVNMLFWLKCVEKIDLHTNMELEKRHMWYLSFSDHCSYWIPLRSSTNSGPGSQGKSQNLQTDALSHCLCLSQGVNWWAISYPFQAGNKSSFCFSACLSVPTPLPQLYFSGHCSCALWLICLNYSLCICIGWKLFRVERVWTICLHVLMALTTILGHSKPSTNVSWVMKYLN